MCATSPAPSGCSPGATSSSRNSQPTTRIRCRPSITWLGRISRPAITSFSACTAWARRFTGMWLARETWTGPAGFTRPSARMRRCSPISCAGFWRTAPTAPSCISLPTRKRPSKTLPPIPSRRRPNTEARRIPPSCCRKICSARSERIRGASIFRTPGRAKSWSAPSMKARRQSWKPRQSSPPRCCQPPLRGRSSIPRTTPISWATPRTPARSASRTPWLPPLHRRRNGRGSGLRNAPQFWSGARTCWSSPWSGCAS